MYVQKNDEIRKEYTRSKRVYDYKNLVELWSILLILSNLQHSIQNIDLWLLYRTVDQWWSNFQRLGNICINLFQNCKIREIWSSKNTTTIRSDSAYQCAYMLVKLPKMLYLVFSLGRHHFVSKKTKVYTCYIWGYCCPKQLSF